MSDIDWQQGIDWNERIAQVSVRLAKNGLLYKAEESSRLIDKLCTGNPLSRYELLQSLGLIEARDKAIFEIDSFAANGCELAGACEQTIIGFFKSEALGERVFLAAHDVVKQNASFAKEVLVTAVDKKLHDFVTSVLCNVTMALQGVGGGSVWSPGIGGWYIDDPSEYVVSPGFRAAWVAARAVNA